MLETNQRFGETNDIRMYIAEQGHDSWLFRVTAFLNSGTPGTPVTGTRRSRVPVVTPDQRGYGRTDRPESIEAYHILHCPVIALATTKQDEGASDEEGN